MDPRVKKEIRDMTPARLNALKAYRDGEPVANRSGYACRARGLAAFLWECTDGIVRTNDKVAQDFNVGARSYDLIRVLKTTLTPLGREVLRAALTERGE